MSDYTIYRNIYLSLIDSIKQIAPSGVAVVDETEEDLITSSIGVYPSMVRYSAYELGNAIDSNVFGWDVGVYANTAQERDYLSLLVYNKLKDWVISVKDYSGTEQVLGTLYVKDDITVRPMRAPKEEVDKLRYFSLISFQTTYQEA